jgi:hypothetical protein
VNYYLKAKPSLPEAALVRPDEWIAWPVQAAEAL